MRKTFRDGVSSLFRELPQCTADAEVDWGLSKAFVDSSAARECRRKRFDVANKGKRVTSWWNQELKEAIQAVLPLCCYGKVLDLMIKKTLHSQKNTRLQTRDRFVRLQENWCCT